MNEFPYPSEENSYLKTHVDLLMRSLLRWTGQVPFEGEQVTEEIARQLFEAPFVICSHNTADDPILNYGNRAALTMWEADWPTFTSMPSRKTAEMPSQAERNLLLDRVTQHGFIDDYKGVRISLTGRRFLIEQATVWNLIDESDKYCGQAAMFDRWEYL